MGNLSGLNFDAGKVAPAGEFAPLPAGAYRVAIVDCVVKTTKDGAGSYISVEYQVNESGQYDGRKIFDRITLDNANADAVRIGHACLSSLGRATGVMTPQDTGDFIGKMLSVTVKVSPGRGTYGPSNDVTKRETIAGKQAVAKTGADAPPF